MTGLELDKRAFNRFSKDRLQSTDIIDKVANGLVPRGHLIDSPGFEAFVVAVWVDSTRKLSSTCGASPIGRSSFFDSPWSVCAFG